MYTEKVLEHFKNPRNQGVLDDPSSVGQEGNPNCGDIMKMYIKVGQRQQNGQQEEYLEDIRFETLGCAAAIAVSSALTELAKDKSLVAVMELTRQDVIDELGGLPAPKIHCSMLGVDALHTAVNNYKQKQQTASGVGGDTELEIKIKEAIELVRPSLQADGGDLQFVDFNQETGCLRVRFSGMCVGCPMSTLTLNQVIATEVQAAVPEVKTVQAV
jgi:nitrogen fixation NifU-like protein